VIFTCLATHFIGDPVNLLVDREFSGEEDRQELIAAGGFDRPVWVQFGDYAAGVARGDFGRSIWQNRPAARVVLERVPATALLAAVALVFTWVVAVPAAVLAARNAGRWPDTLVTALATAGASTASFWWALVLILIFAVRLGWLPTSGYGGWQFLVLPVLALTPGAIGRITQVLQSSLMTELRQPYIATARAKGLRERTVVGRHLLRNTALVGVTLLGAEVIGLLNGAVLVESIFAWPGVGQVTLQAIHRRDLPVLMAAVFYVGVLVTAVNLLVDLLYVYLDPRVRLS
jgi:peptide/nickel transport system permease protein